MKLNETNLYSDSGDMSGDEPGGAFVESATVTTSEEVLNDIVKNMTIMFFYFFKENLKNNLNSYLAPANFYGEAETFIHQHPELQITDMKKARKEYAAAIFAEFCNNIDSVIEYDEEVGVIKINPYVADLEFGSFYRPAVGIISNAFKEFMAQLQQDIDSGEGGQQ